MSRIPARAPKLERIEHEHAAKQPMKLAVCILIPECYPQHARTEPETYLSISRRNDFTQWGVPGGKVDPGEDAITALIRETFEELGIRVRAEDLVPIFSEVCPGKGPEDTYWVTTYLWARPPGLLSQPIVTEPGFEAAWCYEATLTDPATSPFAHYNVGLLAAYRRFFGRDD